MNTQRIRTTQQEIGAALAKQSMVNRLVKMAELLGGVRKARPATTERERIRSANRAIQVRLHRLEKVSADDIHSLLNTLEELSEDTSLPKSLKKPVSDLMDALESLSVGDLKALADGDAGEDDGDEAAEAGAGAGAGAAGAAGTDASADKATYSDLMKRARRKPIMIRPGMTV